jgi:hypothetical protein
MSYKQKLYLLVKLITYIDIRPLLKIFCKEISSLQCTAYYVNCMTADNVGGSKLSSHVIRNIDFSLSLSLFFFLAFYDFLKMTFRKLWTIQLSCFHCVFNKCIILTGKHVLSDFICILMSNLSLSHSCTRISAVSKKLTADILNINIPFMAKVWYFLTSSQKCLEITLRLI